MYRKFVLFLAALALSGCAALSGISDIVNENTFLVDTVVSQATARVIEAQPDTKAAAAETIRVVDNALLFIDKNPKAIIADVVSEFINSINWDNMSVSDRILVENVIIEVQKSLLSRVEDGDIPADELIGIRSVLGTAKRTAQMFL
jgi:hypothetical protein